MSQPCDLCGLDCGIKPLTLNAPDKTLHFCCEGCKGIYEMLHEIKETPDEAAQNDRQES